MNAKSIFTLTILFFTHFALLGQTENPVILSTAGTVDHLKNLSLEWTLGELAVQSATEGKLIITEGYHQPVLKVSPGNIESTNVNYRISVSPNPVASILNIRIFSQEDTKITLTLSDLNGRVLFVENGTSKMDSKEIDMGNYVNGMYVLEIRNASGTMYRTYKISKAQ